MQKAGNQSSRAFFPPRWLSRQHNMGKEKSEQLRVTTVFTVHDQQCRLQLARAVLLSAEKAVQRHGKEEKWNFAP